MNCARRLVAWCLCLCFLLSLAGSAQAGGGGGGDPKQKVRIQNGARNTVSLRSVLRRHTYSMRVRYTYDGEVLLDKTYRDGQTLDQPVSKQTHDSGRTFSIEVWLYNETGALVQHAAANGTPQFTKPSPYGNVIGAEARNPNIDVYVLQWANYGGEFVLDMVCEPYDYE